MSATLTTHPSGSYPRRASASPRSGAGFGQRVWNALMRLGAARARPHLERLAQLHEHSNPELARQLRQSVRDGLI